MVSSDGPDVEKHAGVTNLLYEDNSGAVAGESFEYGDSVYAKLQRFAGKLNVEQRGIERVPEDERTDTSYLNIGSMVRLNLRLLYSDSLKCKYSVQLMLTVAVVLCQYGRRLVRNRRPRKIALLCWFHRRYLDSPVLQLPGSLDRLLLLHLRCPIWSSSNGCFSLLVRLVGSEIEYEHMP